MTPVQPELERTPQYDDLRYGARVATHWPGLAPAGTPSACPQFQLEPDGDPDEECLSASGTTSQGLSPPGPRGWLRRDRWSRRMRSCSNLQVTWRPLHTENVAAEQRFWSPSPRTRLGPRRGPSTARPLLRVFAMKPLALQRWGAAGITRRWPPWAWGPVLWNAPKTPIDCRGRFRHFIVPTTELRVPPTTIARSDGGLLRGPLKTMASLV